MEIGCVKKGRLTDLIVVKTRVASHNVWVVVLAVKDESIRGTADFGALLGRVEGCR
jgi:hypothetical protein